MDKSSKIGVIIFVVVLILALVIGGYVMGKKEDGATEQENQTSDETYVNVVREGLSDMVKMKKHDSSMGYTMSYDAERFTFVNREGADFFEEKDTCNCVVVEKENTAYQTITAGLEKAMLGEKEVPYRTRVAEGQLETSYYFDGGNGVTFVVITSCQDDSEYIEGLGEIMSAMVQTFQVK